MKHRTFKLFASAVILAALTSFTALAATAINSVNFTFTIDGDTNIADGYNEPTIDVSSQYGYEVFDCTVSASDTSLASGKNPVSYTLTLTADRGYYFPNANSIQVTGNGITEITKKTTSGWDDSELTIKFKAYPYVRLAAPSFETDFDSVKGSKSKSQSSGRDTSVSINKNGASKIEFVVSYVDQDGEYRTKGGSVTGSTIQVGSYNKQYTGSSINSPLISAASRSARQMRRARTRISRRVNGFTSPAASPASTPTSTSPTIRPGTTCSRVAAAPAAPLHHRPVEAQAATAGR